MSVCQVLESVETLDPGQARTLLAAVAVSRSRLEPECDLMRNVIRTGGAIIRRMVRIMTTGCP